MRQKFVQIYLSEDTIFRTDKPVNWPVLTKANR